MRLSPGPPALRDRPGVIRAVTLILVFASGRGGQRGVGRCLVFHLVRPRGPGFAHGVVHCGWQLNTGSGTHCVKQATAYPVMP
jgi:hypothetical protein